MSMENIETLLTSTANTYNEMLNKFRPCKPGSEFLEQNLISLFTHEFINAHPDGVAFSEIPFINNLKNDHWNARLDGFFMTDEFCIFLEAKGSLNSNNFFSAVDSDVQRILSNKLRVSFERMMRGKTLPDTKYGVVLGDTWQGRQATIWQEKSFAEEFKHLPLLKTQVHKGIKFDEKDQHYILSGIVRC